MPDAFTLSVFEKIFSKVINYYVPLGHTLGKSIFILGLGLADVFKHFEKGGEFFCFAGQSTQAVTGMYNLYRASQVLFPGEKVLEDAKKFSSNFLREKQVANELFDKWIITKDLPGEVWYIFWLINKRATWLLNDQKAARDNNMVAPQGAKS